MNKTTYHSVHANPTDENHGPPKDAPHMLGRKSEIALALSLMTIPLSLFSALLIGLIFHYRVTLSDPVSSDLQLPDSPSGKNVIYVSISATTLTTVASWSSTIAPMLVGSAITLISYPVAKKILRAGDGGKREELPTPWQLSLMLRMITSGSPIALWNWILYSWGWRGKREKQGSPMKLMSGILILALGLSTFVFATDTWFHFTTKTINLTQVHSLSTPLNTSIGLLPKCYNQPNPHDSGCTLNIGASANFILGGSESYKVMANLSSSIRINTLVRDNDTFAYIGKPPSPALEPIDYVSHSWALKTQCTPVTSQCIGTNLPGAFFKYNCPFAMQGIVSTDRNSAYQNQFVMNYFTNSTAMSNDTGRTNLGNPYFHATIAVVNQNLGHAATLTGDPEIAGTGHGADIFAFFCNTTVYDVEYASVNSTITKFETKLANSTLANIIQGTQQYTAIGDAALIQGAGIGDIVSSSVQGAADYYAMTYSQVALNVATVAFTPQTAIQAQRRETMLVAKVPIVPLACLLGANLALALLGIVLAVLAVVKSKGEVREVQARLSVSALVAALFEGRRSEGAVESVEGLFEERGGRGGPKIGLVKSAGGGWKYSVWRPT